MKWLKWLFVLCLTSTSAGMIGPAATSYASGGYSWEFNTNGSLEGWTTVQIGGVSVSGGELTGSTGSGYGADPQLVSPSNLGIVAKENTKIAIRMKIGAGSSGKLYWATDNEPMSEKTAMTFVPIADSAYHEYEFNMLENENWSGVVNRIRIDPNSGNTGTIAVDYIRIVSAGADLKYTLGQSSLSVEPGATFKLYAALENKGDVTATAPQATLSLPAGLTLVNSQAVQSVPNLSPLARHTVEWQVQGAAGVYNVSATLSGTNIAAQTKQLKIVIAGDDASATFRSANTPNVYTTAGGSVVLENVDHRIVFVKDASLGFVRYHLDVWNGTSWYTAAATMPFSKLAYEWNGKKERSLYPSSHTVVQSNAGAAEVRFDGTFVDEGGANWTYSMTFRMDAGENEAAVDYTVVSDQARGLYRFEGPIIRAGDGSFGKQKKDAVFSGLEWLENDEESSVIGPDFRNEKGIRLVPKYHKITTPVMAVSYNDIVVGLDWDPNQIWDGTNKLPSAQFSVPNRLEAQDNSQFGLFVPSTFNNVVPENELYANVARPLTANQTVTLQSNIYVKKGAAEGSVDAVWDYVDRTPQTLQPMPSPNRTPEDWVDLSANSLMETLWKSSLNGWESNLGKAQYEDVVPYPERAAALYRYAMFTTDPTKRSAAKARVQEVKVTLDSRYGPGKYGPELPYYVGGVAESLSQQEERIKAIIGSQKDDGNWPYAGNVLYGEPGSSSMGVTATNALNVLSFARLTGSKEAIESGLKGIAAANQYLVPRGAQSWESSLHSPDVLAAAKAVQANVMAYEITNDIAYKDNAVRWAKKGLPFLYTWKADDKSDAMKFATTPLFSSSWYWRSWIGEPVPWNALAYGNALRMLGKYDLSSEWDTIAEGTYRSAAYMQQTNGTYPDIYFLSGNWWGSPWLYPGELFKVSMKNAGFAYYDLASAIVRSGVDAYAVSSPGTISSASLSAGNQLTFGLNYPNGETSYTTIGGLGKPASIMRNGTLLSYAADLSAVSEGWTYSSNISGLVVVKLLHGASAVNVAVNGVSPAAAWTFGVNGDTQGWSVAAQSSLTAQNGTLAVAAGGASPAIKRTVSMTASDYECFVLKAAASGGKLAKLSWKRSGDSGWDDSRSVQFGIEDGGMMRTYVIDPSTNANWNGTITEVKLEWPDSGTGDSIAIGEAKFAFSAQEAAGPIEWDFNADGDAQGWSAAYQIVSQAVANGEYSGDSTGVDPQLKSSDINRQTQSVFQMRMKASDTGSAQLFWSVPKPFNTYITDRSFTLPTNAANRYQDYSAAMGKFTRWGIDLQNWIKSFRLDPATKSNVQFDIDYIGFLPEPDQQYYSKLWTFDAGTENWTGSSTGTPTASGGALQATATGSNPRLLSPVEAFDANYNYFTIRMKASGGTKASLIWRYANAPFTEERKQTIPIVADNQYHEYTILASRNTEQWKGAIEQIGLQFDDAPANASIAVDYVKVGEFAERETDWTWSVDGDDEGWQNTNDLSAFAVEEGVLTTTVTGSNPADPYMVSPSIAAPAASNPVVRLRMAVSGSAPVLSGSLYWDTDQNAGFSSARQIRFPVIADGKLRTYEISLKGQPGWSGEIRRLRLDPGPSATGDTVRLDFIRLVNRAEAIPLRWDFAHNGMSKGWDIRNHLGAPTASVDGLTYGMSGTDPFVAGPPISIDAGRYKYARIVMSTPAGNGTTAALSWLKEGGTWNSNDRYTFPIAGGSQLVEYLVPLGTLPNWSGSIVKLRLDPVQNPGLPSGSITIKEITLMP